MFTISVGNLPPGASVLIKITYVSELVVSGGRINFSLPGSLAPWQVSDGLKQITQVRGGAGILKSKLSVFSFLLLCFAASFAGGF